MKKLCLVLSLGFILSSTIAIAHPHGYYHHSGCSNCVYVIRSENFQHEEKFLNCDRHYALVDTTVNYYSNGAKRSFKTYSVINEDGTTLISNCYNLKHVTQGKKHFFIAKIGKYYQILDENGIEISKRKYSYASLINQDKILVSVNKMYGVIDIKENIIVPIKYKSFEQLSSNLFKTKLNGYFGLVDSEGNILLKPEFDKIKPLYDTYVTKKAGKFGLVDFRGNTILTPDFDEIKKLGEYILVKKDKKYGVFDAQGVKLSEINHKKIKLERNELVYL